MIPEIKIAYYRKQDWKKFLKNIDDRKTQYDTWKEWYEEYKNTRNGLKDIGIIVHEITIDIDALSQHCQEHGLKNDGKTRSEYVSQLPLTEKRK